MEIAPNYVNKGRQLGMPTLQGCDAAADANSQPRSLLTTETSRSCHCIQSITILDSLLPPCCRRLNFVDVTMHMTHGASYALVITTHRRLVNAAFHDSSGALKLHHCFEIASRPTTMSRAFAGIRATMLAEGLVTPQRQKTHRAHS